MTLNLIHAYTNTGPAGWNTCGQAAIATILDFHGVDPFHLPRDSQGHWNSGEIIDAIKRDGMGPDVIFGWGTTPNRIGEALAKYGLHVRINGASPVFPRSRSSLFVELRAFLDADLPVPVLVDLGALGGPALVAHWPIAFKVADGRVHLANCSTNRTPEINQFISAWHAWFLPGLSWMSVVATRDAPTRWSEIDGGILHTSDGVDVIEYAIEHNAVGAGSLEFSLRLGGRVTWTKVVNVPDGSGHVSSVFAEMGKQPRTAKMSFAARSDKALTFSKPKEFGIFHAVMRLVDLDQLNDGDRVVFTWVKD
jgi:hypothetical protein